jgi:hypothetical protein
MRVGRGDKTGGLMWRLQRLPPLPSNFLARPVTKKRANSDFVGREKFEYNIWFASAAPMPVRGCFVCTENRPEKNVKGGLFTQGGLFSIGSLVPPLDVHGCVVGGARWTVL